MRKVIYSISVTLDGFIAGPGGDISWGAPSPELHRFHNERVRDVGVQLCGRRLYEVMTYWDTLDVAAAGPIEREFADVWRALPKIVFSGTLTEVGPNARLAQAGLAEVIAELRSQPGGDIAVGGATLAGEAIERGLVDRFDLFVVPVLIGAGTPCFPPGTARTDLRLTASRTFGEVVHLRYDRA